MGSRLLCCSICSLDSDRVHGGRQGLSHVSLDALQQLPVVEVLSHLGAEAVHQHASRRLIVYPPRPVHDPMRSAHHRSRCIAALVVLLIRLKVARWSATAARLLYHDSAPLIKTRYDLHLSLLKLLLFAVRQIANGLLFPQRICHLGCISISFAHSQRLR